MKKITIILSLFILCSCNNTSETLKDELSIDNTIDEINEQVINQALSEYKLAEKTGDLIEIYNASSLLKEAYKQANNEEKYLEWFNKEKELAHQLGLDY